MTEVRVQVQDGINGSMLTAPDEPAIVPDDMPAEELVPEILKAPRNEARPATANHAKIVNRTRGREITGEGTLADAGTQDGDLLVLFYTTVYGGWGPTDDAGQMGVFGGRTLDVTPTDRRRKLGLQEYIGLLLR